MTKRDNERERTREGEKWGEMEDTIWGKGENAGVGQSARKKEHKKEGTNGRGRTHKKKGEEEGTRVKKNARKRQRKKRKDARKT